MPVRRTLLALAVTIAAPTVFAQTPLAAPQPAAAAPIPVFEVISVKQDKPAQMTQTWTANIKPDGYAAKGITLMYLLMYAYDIRPKYRVIGAPTWSDENRYDIQAKVGDADVAAFQELNFPQRIALVQQVLTERFKLKVHRETKVHPIYSLVVVRQGVLTEAPPRADGVKPFAMRPGRGDRAGQMVVTDFSLPALAANLSGILGRTVIDNTGLNGQYHADLHWTPDRWSSMGSDPAANTQELSIFTALQEQAGLKLVPTEGPVECLVIDHVELPSEN